MKLQVFRGKGGWFWRIRASNGRKLATSESYVRKRSAKKIAASLGLRLGVAVEG